jgi:xanthine/uracil/vitamin C permease (AzgA family)
VKRTDPGALISPAFYCRNLATTPLAMLPFTSSIAHGIGYGFITYVGVQVLDGRPRRRVRGVFSLGVLTGLTGF